MILTHSDGSTKRASSETIAALKACDRVETYSECGWFCASGFKDGNRVIGVHFNSMEEYERSMGIGAPRPWPPRYR